MFFPAAYDNVGCLDTAHDRNKCNIRKPFSKFGKLKGKSRTGDDNVRTGFTGGPHKRLVIAERAHAVDGKYTAHSRVFCLFYVFSEHLAVAFSKVFGVISLSQHSKAN